MRIVTGFLLLVSAAYGQQTAREKHLNLESFEKVWTTIRDKHWEKNPGGLDWQKIHDEFRPKIEQASSNSQAREIMREMLGRLHETHFAIFPGNVYDDVNADGGGSGSAGFDTRVLGGQVIVVSVDAGSPAEKAGVATGWAVARVDGKDLSAIVEKIEAVTEIRELTLERAVQAALSGPEGGEKTMVFLDGANGEKTLKLKLDPPRGEPSHFGNLPTEYVWFESKKFGNTGYVRFNMFLDLARVMGRFGQAVTDCRECDGFVIDLRGNPGGIGGMAMGMAGFLVSKPDQKLGTMFMRDNSLKFVINPRAQAFTGPVAVLVDGCSASTSEIFAGGLQDLGRARIFGTKTAAAALPSFIEKLPNGDGFQYAMANYVSEGGKTLEANGVTPDVEVKLTRAALLEGHDAVIDAALNWIQQQRSRK
jgi:carboxyl-terminal processing protease